MRFEDIKPGMLVSHSYDSTMLGRVYYLQSETVAVNWYDEPGVTHCYNKFYYETVLNFPIEQFNGDLEEILK